MDLLQQADLIGAPTPNLPLLRKVLDHIDAHPEEWRQLSWVDENACKTAFCVAGHAVAMTVGLTRGADGNLIPADGLCFFDSAREALGLQAEEAHRLFWGENTREHVQFYAGAIAERAGERL